MVYEIVWTDKAGDSYVSNMRYLEQEWTKKETDRFIQLVERKLKLISLQPFIGSPRNKKNNNIRFTILGKRMALVYHVRSRKKQIELLLFWNTYQHPKKLKV
jgi:plasmid stabilization system protein ParE